MTMLALVARAETGQTEATVELCEVVSGRLYPVVRAAEIIVIVVAHKTRTIPE